MALTIDLQAVPFACPACGSSFGAQIGKLKGDANLSCPHCGHAAAAEAADFCRRIAAIRRRFDALERALAHLER